MAGCRAVPGVPCYRSSKSSAEQTSQATRGSGGKAPGKAGGHDQARDRESGEGGSPSPLLISGRSSSGHDPYAGVISFQLLTCVVTTQIAVAPGIPGGKLFGSSGTWYMCGTFCIEK
jgi:hypothetical protein